MIIISLIITLAIVVIPQNVFGTVYITDGGKRRVLELKGRTEPCVMHNDVVTVAKMFSEVYMQKMSSNDLDTLSAFCRDSEKIGKQGGFFYPGTKWCGPGNTATSYNDLGQLTEEDKCCREHDHCPNQLEPGQCRQGICNTSPFTRSHCNCDNAFKACLRGVNSDAANTIGALYFNIVQVTCFEDRRQCPQYLREDSSYAWFCEAWKFVPNGEYNATVLQQSKISEERIPIRPPNSKSKHFSKSNIEINLKSLNEGDPNAQMVMGNGQNQPAILDKTPPKKSMPPLLNSIAGAKNIWRD